MDTESRPPGVSSRITRADGPRHPWLTGEVTVDLPVIVDWVKMDPASGEQQARVAARIDLVAGKPEVVEMSLISHAGLDLVELQRDFRWASR